MTRITCDYCDAHYTVTVKSGQVHCPKCGGVQAIEEKSAMPSLSERTELAPQPSEEMVLPEKDPEVEPEKDAKTEWIERLAPTLVVALLFLFWAAYDKLVRTPRYEEAVSWSIRAFRTGDLDRAHKEAQRALSIRPNSPVAQELNVLTGK